MSSHSQHDDQADNIAELNSTKDQLLTDIVTLRDQLSENEELKDAIPTLESIPLLQADNIPVLGDAVGHMINDVVKADGAMQSTLASDHGINSLFIDDSELNKLQTTGLESDDLTTKDQESEKHSTDSNTTDTQGNANINHALSTGITSAGLLASQEIISDVTVEALSEEIHLESAQLEETPLAQSHAKDNQEISGTSKSDIAKTEALDIREENPFLPQHLRDRLDQSKNSLFQEIARSGESLEASTALLRNFAYDKTTFKGASNRAAEPNSSKTSTSSSHLKQQNHQDIIDSLVEKYLPMIETDLRQHLTLLLEENDS